MNNSMRYALHAAHDLAGAIWFGGNLFGIAALNPAVRAATSSDDRGAVANQAWENFIPYGLGSALTLGATWVGMRMDEPRFNEPALRDVARIHDLAVGSVVVLTVAGGVLNRLAAESVPADRTPMEDGLTPADKAPEAAKGSLIALRAVAVGNLLAGSALLVSSAVLEQKLMEQGPIGRALLPFQRVGHSAGMAASAFRNIAAFEMLRRGGKMLAESFSHSRPEPQNRLQQVGEGARTLWRERVLHAA